MYVLHLSCRRGGDFYVWAEDSEAARAEEKESPDATDHSEPREHPFAADVWDLWDLFAELAPGYLLERAGDREALLALPTRGGTPCPSPDLPISRSEDSQPAEVTAWRAPVLELPGAVAARWLSESIPRPRDVAYAAEWEGWERTALLADMLVNEGRLLPELRRDPGGEDFEARWQPVPSRSAEREQLRAIESFMPAAIRADVGDQLEGDDTAAEFSPPHSGRELLRSGLASMADGLARSRLGALFDGSAPRTADPTERAWLEALTSDDPTVDADAGELAELQRQLQRWQRDLKRSLSRRGRLHLRLHPPELDEDDSPEDTVTPVLGTWRLEFLLQSADEPSLIVHAATVWSAPDEARQTLDRHIDRPDELLLEELGRARSLYPPLDRALEHEHPTELELDTEGAFAFLDEYAELLDRAGFSVHVPSWWNEADHRLGARMRAESRADGDLGLEAVCRFDWEIALGDETLDREELEQLAELKRPLVRHGDEWVVLDDDELDAALEMVDQKGQMRAGEALRTALGLEETELPVVDAEFEGWLSDLFDPDDEAGVQPREAPESFDGTLRPYQRRGLGWLRYLERRGLGGCLADDMGLGKTIQLLARLADERQDDDTRPGPTLAVVPLSVVGNWRREAERFTPQLSVAVHHGPDRPEGDALEPALTDADLVVTTYGVVRSDIDQLESIRWHRVVLDEAQKVKNSSAGRTQAVRRLRADRRLALTGTPVENRLTELWSIMQFLNPGMLGPESQFRREIARPVEAGDETTTELLRRLTGPFVLRRLKTDEQIIEDLPEKTEIKEYCNLTAEQVTLYRAAVDEMMERVEDSDGMDRRGAILKLMTELKQICNHPAHFRDEDEGKLAERSGKLDRLEELAAEIDGAGDKALIFTQYTEMGRRIRRHLRSRLGRRTLYLHGQTEQTERERMVDRFQDPDGPPFFLLSLRAGGTGLTLTEANHVIHFDRWWNPAVEDQATDRAFRIGQTDDVQVRKLICEGTFEERIDEMIDQKRALAERVLSEGESFLTELSNDELREVVTLSEEVLS
ncbi:MAG: DEAD/DEAH box helicase [Bradymonadaceae bacterium]